MTVSDKQLSTKVPTVEATLRKLFLTLFLRGRTGMGDAKKIVAPTSIANKLGLILVIYSIVGATSFIFVGRELFLLSAYIHAFSFMMVGMFLVSSAGETLFNKEETEILGHRPILPKTLLWSKMIVLIQVAVYLSFAVSFLSLFAGLKTSDGSWLYAPVHIVSSLAEALFCAGSVVLGYQLCLRWLGRRRLDGIMTTVQVIVMAVFVIGSQLLPRLMMGNMTATNEPIARPWWFACIAPAWFAGIDDALAGSHSRFSWELAGIGVLLTVAVTWLAFVKLATDYDEGVQTMNEAVAPTESHNRQLRLLGWITQKSPVQFWLKSSVERVSFVLATAYLLRDRETKLRVYPSLTSVLIMPVVMTVQNTTIFNSPTFHHHSASSGPPPVVAMGSIFGNMMMAFAGGFLGSTSMSAISFLSYSQQWKASEVFYLAPIPGPYLIQKGVMVAVNVLVIAPTLVVLAAFGVFTHQANYLPLILPGAFLIPVYSRLPALIQGAVPFSRASEEMQSVRRGCFAMASPFFAFIVAGIALLFNYFGWLTYMLAGELALVVLFCFFVDKKLADKPWKFSD